ncbi:MAG TPA: hypothetical protein VFX86_01690 [Candidatus Saccharimonadales bacterium]|nr:hypothetical protein [Candidatus Saccharimonadales bacterium]
MGVGMSNPEIFTVKTSQKKGTISGYMREGSDEVIAPEDIGRYLEGGERISYKREVYRLDEHGNLIHCDIELPENLSLGSGVLLGPNIVFTNPSNDKPTVIEDRVAISGETRLRSGLHIATHTVVRLGASIGESDIGPYGKIGPRTNVSDGVSLGASVVTGENVQVSSGVTAESHVRIDDNAVIGPNAELGARVYIGEGVRIPQDMIIGPNSRLRTNNLA